MDESNAVVEAVLNTAIEAEQQASEEVSAATEAGDAPGLAAAEAARNASSALRTQMESASSELQAARERRKKAADEVRVQLETVKKSAEEEAAMFAQVHKHVELLQRARATVNTAKSDRRMLKGALEEDISEDAAQTQTSTAQSHEQSQEQSTPTRMRSESSLRKTLQNYQNKSSMRNTAAAVRDTMQVVKLCWNLIVHRLSCAQMSGLRAFNKSRKLIAGRKTSSMSQLSSHAGSTLVGQNVRNVELAQSGVPEPVDNIAETVETDAAVSQSAVTKSPSQPEQPVQAKAQQVAFEESSPEATHPPLAEAGAALHSLEPREVAQTVEAPMAVAPKATAPTAVAPTAVAPTAVAPKTVAPKAVVPKAVAPAEKAEDPEVRQRAVSKPAAASIPAPAEERMAVVEKEKDASEETDEGEEDPHLVVDYNPETDAALREEIQRALGPLEKSQELPAVIHAMASLRVMEDNCEALGQTRRRGAAVARLQLRAVRGEIRHVRSMLDDLSQLDAAAEMLADFRAQFLKSKTLSAWAGGGSRDGNSGGDQVDKLALLDAKVSVLSAEVNRLGGWKASFYFADGSINMDIKTSVWPEAVQVKMLNELRSTLHAHLQEANAEADEAQEEAREANEELGKALKQLEDAKKATEESKRYYSEMHEGMQKMKAMQLTEEDMKVIADDSLDGMDVENDENDEMEPPIGEPNQRKMMPMYHVLHPTKKGIQQTNGIDKAQYERARMLNVKLATALRRERVASAKLHLDLTRSTNQVKRVLDEHSDDKQEADTLKAIGLSAMALGDVERAERIAVQQAALSANEHTRNKDAKQAARQAEEAHSAVEGDAHRMYEMAREDAQAAAAQIAQGRAEGTLLEGEVAPGANIDADNDELTRSLERDGQRLDETMAFLNSSLTDRATSHLSRVRRMESEIDILINSQLRMRRETAELKADFSSSDASDVITSLRARVADLRSEADGYHKRITEEQENAKLTKNGELERLEETTRKYANLAEVETALEPRLADVDAELASLRKEGERTAAVGKSKAHKKDIKRLEKSRDALALRLTEARREVATTKRDMLALYERVDRVTQYIFSGATYKAMLVWAHELERDGPPGSPAQGHTGGFSSMNNPASSDASASGPLKADPSFAYQPPPVHALLGNGEAGRTARDALFGYKAPKKTGQDPKGPLPPIPMRAHAPAIAGVPSEVRAGGATDMARLQMSSSTPELREVLRANKPPAPPEPQNLGLLHKDRGVFPVRSTHAARQQNTKLLRGPR